MGRLRDLILLGSDSQALSYIRKRIGGGGGGATSFSALSGTAWNGTNAYTTLTANTSLTLDSTANAGLLYIAGNNSYTLTINGVSIAINNTGDTLVGYVKVNGSYLFSVELNVLGTYAPPTTTTMAGATTTSTTTMPVLTLDDITYNTFSGAITESPNNTWNFPADNTYTVDSTRALAGDGFIEMDITSDNAPVLGFDDSATNTNWQTGGPTLFNYTAGVYVYLGEIFTNFKPTGTSSAVSRGMRGSITKLRLERTGTNIVLKSSTNGTTYSTIATIASGISAPLYAKAARAVTGQTQLINPKSYGFIDADAAAFISASAITDTTQKSAVTQLVTDLKTAAIWTKMKAVYPFVGGTAAAHKFNLKNPVDTDGGLRLTFNGSWTHNANGVLPGGTIADYAETYFIPSANFAANSGSMGGYVREAMVLNNCLIGALDGTRAAHMSRAGASSQTYWNMGDAQSGAQPAPTAPPSWDGFLATSRTGTTAATNIHYRNGTQFSVSGQAYSGWPTNSFIIGARRVSATIDVPMNKTIAFLYISDGLSAGEMASLNTAVQTFETTLGRNI